LTGISGLSKADILDRICTFCNCKDKKGSGADLDVVLDSVAFENASVDVAFDLEHEMCSREELRVPNYLDVPEKNLLNAKNRTLDRIIQESERKENVILAMHAVYYRRSSLFCLLDWKRLAEFKPDIFVTVIDDVYMIKNRIQHNPNAGPVRYISLKDILWWREVESLVAQQIARNIHRKGIPHYLIAREQIPTLIYQLMFESNKKKVYASYPVTSAKSDPALLSETSEFLRKLKRHFIVFDPMAIGEKLLQDALIENLRTPHPEPYIRIRRGKEEFEYDVGDVLPVISDINGQIVSRDERLIIQSDIVIGYRPTLSPGAQHELRYARNTSRVEALVVHPSEDGHSPFVYELADEIHPTVDRLLESLQKKGYFSKQP